MSLKRQAIVLLICCFFYMLIPGFSASAEKGFTLEASESEFVLQPSKSQKFQVYQNVEDEKSKDITMNSKTIYKSSSSSIVTVAKGLVKAGKKEGEAVITVSYEGVSLEIPVIVAKDQVKELSPSVSVINLKEGESISVDLTAEFSSGKTKDVTSLATWLVGDSTVATVDKGEIEAIKDGVTNIIASYKGEKAEITVNVEGNNVELEGLEASDQNIKLSKDHEEEVSIWAVYSDGNKELLSDDDIVWKPAKRSIADVIDGVIVGKKVGRTSISATYKGETISIKVEVVTKPKLKSLSVNKKKLTIEAGNTAKITLKALYVDDTTEDVTLEASWRSKRSEIADVEEGVIEGVKVGRTTIVASYEGKTITVTVDVKAADPAADKTPPTVDASKFTAVDNYNETEDQLEGLAGAVGEAEAIVKVYPWNDLNNNSDLDEGELEEAIDLGTSEADGTVAAANIGDLNPGLYQFIITATDGKGNESVKSTAAVVTAELKNGEAGTPDTATLTIDEETTADEDL